MTLLFQISYPASWVMKSTLCVLHCWGASFINSSRLSSSHPELCSVTTVALEAEENCINQMTGKKKKENEVIFPVEDQGKRHHLLLQWQWLWGLLRDITLVSFWLHTNAHVKIYGEIKAPCNGGHERFIKRNWVNNCNPAWDASKWQDLVFQG